jgi:exodeoxyribonuclease V beta subunit
MSNESINEFSIRKFSPSRSIYIQASAGTGKTYTIQLMVAKMLAEGTPLKKILIVTYTEKAAGELKDRIRKKIDEVLANGRIDKDVPDLAPEQLAFFRKAYQDVDNAAIFTIHSFCQKALKEYAYDAGRPFDMAMIDDSAAEDLIDEIIRDQWSTDAEFIALLNNAESTSSFIGALKKAFSKTVDMYKGRDCDGNEIVLLDDVELPRLGDNPLSLEDLEKMASAKKFSDLIFLQGLKENLQSIKDAADSVKKAIPFIETLESWVPNKDLFSGSLFQAKRDFSEETRPSFEYFKSVKDLLKSAGSKVKTIKLHTFLIAHTPEIFEEWQKRKSESKLQSFNDMILSVHRAIMEPGNSLKERLRAQYTYAIIDEFQDTNQLQWDIFRTVFLKEGDTPVPDHSIFVVGDPKQSIYSFQGADVNVYNRATNEIGKKIDLVHNFRSTDGIIDGCNALFAGDYFKPGKDMPKLVDFTDSYPPDGENADKKKAPPVIDGKKVKSIWLSAENVTADSFAATVVAKIIEWCSFSEDGKTTRLQVFDKDYGKPEHDTPLKNVTFKDFAILAKSHSELTNVEAIMRDVGVPYTHYKEANLFRSRECAEWIALFRAINAPDFSSWNRQLLSEVLITDFFKDIVAERERASRGTEQSSGLEELHYTESREFDDPNNQERRQIAAWRALALKHRYAEMLERIYEDSQIEHRLMNVSKLQGMAKLRQIGNYAIDYLYNHRCTLEDLIRHLQGLARYAESADDENGDLVEKGTDFNAVQLMTIHASKGLEFPVVISIAGYKQLPHTSAPVITHGENDTLHIGFGDTAKEKRKSEEMEEWKRLFYVDFTRASSILVIPRYSVWYNEPKEGEAPKRSAYFRHLHFLMDALDSFVEKGTAHYSKIPSNEAWVSDTKAFGKMAALVRGILDRTQNETGAANLDEDIDEQKRQMSMLQGKVAGASILQYSYSSLAGRAETPIAGPDDSRTEKEGASAEDESTGLDTGNYPRGSKVGDALHNILEHTRFFKFGKDYATLDDALSHPSAELVNSIEEEFKAQSLPIAAHRKEWTETTIRFIWNTLHASLPEITGADIRSDVSFQLAGLPDTDHKPEVQFGMNADAKDTTDGNGALAILHRVCKGFIDLLFVRDVDGQKRYSILDWKSDTLDSYGAAEVKAKVDEDYSVQRALYSYCLIQWLKQFYGKGTAENLDEQQIFKDHFGGIYYAFLRGTDGTTSRGIYAHTWKDYAALESAYEKVKELMNKKRIEGEN